MRYIELFYSYFTLICYFLVMNSKEKCINFSQSLEMDYYYRMSSVYIGTPLIVFGLITNCINIIIWSKLIERAIKRNTTCGVYLKIMAYVDNLFLVSYFLIESVPNMVTNIFRKSYVYGFIYGYLAFPMFMYATFLTFWLFAGVVVCRLGIVILPLKLRQDSTFLAKVAIILVGLFCFVVNVPNFFAFQPVHIAPNKICLRLSNVYQTPSYFKYRFWFQCVFLTLLPWVCIVTCNMVIIIIELRRHITHPLKSRRGKEMGQVLFSLSSWFFITILWQCIAQCFWLLKPRGKNINYSFAFGGLGMVFNSSTKLLIYLISSATFRRTLKHLFMGSKSSYKQNIHPNIKILREQHCKKNDKWKSLNAIQPANISSYISESSSQDHTSPTNLSNSTFNNFQASSFP